MQFLMRGPGDGKRLVPNSPLPHAPAYNFLKQTPGFTRELQAYFTIQFPAAAPPAPIYIALLF
jgi:hypothetical protein